MRDRQVCLADEAAQHAGLAQPAQAGGGEGHSRRETSPALKRWPPRFRRPPAGRCRSRAFRGAAGDRLTAFRTARLGLSLHRQIPALEHQVAAQIDDRLAQDRGDRQRHERAQEAGQSPAQQQGEDHQQRVDPQRLAEQVRRDDVALELLQHGEGDDQPDGVQRVAAERRDDHGRERADGRADVRDQLGEAVERAEGERVRLAVREDPQRAEDPQHDPGARAHDQAEQQLAADVAEQRGLDARREVVLRRAVARRDHSAHDRADPVAVDQHVDGEHDHEDQREAAPRRASAARRG